MDQVTYDAVVSAEGEPVDQTNEDTSGDCN